MLFLKSTSSPVAPGIYAVDVAAKPPGTTYMVFVAVDATDPPQSFIEAIEGLGFARVLAKPYMHHDGKKILDLHFGKPGSAVFEGWTQAERDANLLAIEEVLARFQIKANPRVMSSAEAFR